jgi:hypothetical protein
VGCGLAIACILPTLAHDKRAAVRRGIHRAEQAQAAAASMAERSGRP